MTGEHARPSLLRRLALHTRENRAWAMYDWGNSAFFTTVVTAVFPVYFATVSSDGDALRRLMWATTISLGVTAVMAPFLGALADMSGHRKRMLAIFLAIGVAATAGMFFVEPGDWVLGLVLFGVANVGAYGTMVFYDALLPHVADEDDVDQLSTSAYALGYLGGGALLALQLLVIKKPTWFGLPEGSTLPVRLVLVSVAVWWALFSVPLFRRVSEPEAATSADDTVTLGGAWRRLMGTVRELTTYRDAMLFLVAYLIYADGIGTVFRLAASYSKEVGFGDGVTIGALLLTQFVGVPAAFAFGRVAARLGAKRAITVALCVYVVACLIGSGMTEVWHLFALAAMIALVQGGAQALSRSLFASMIPRDRSAEFFGVFAIFEKFGGVFGPLLFIVVKEALSDPAAPERGTRYAVASVAGLFVIGALLLRRVNVEEGRRVARAAEAASAETAG